MRNVKYTLALLLSLGLAAFMSVTVFAEESYSTPYPVGEYSVKPDGTGDFSSIQEGVDALPSGSTLIIYPGSYEESIKIQGKTINLQGIDRDTCIISYNTQYYPDPVLSLAAGNVSNLTLNGYHSESCPSPEEMYHKYEGTEYASLLMYMAYTIHVDQDYMYGKELSFDNCTIIAGNAHCLGVGMRGSSSLSFTDCTLIQNGWYTAYGIMFLHDSSLLAFAGDATIAFQNCQLATNISQYLFYEQSLHSESHIELLFQNNAVSDADILTTINHYEIGDTQWQGANNISLSPESRGNSREELNY